MSMPSVDKELSEERLRIPKELIYAGRRFSRSGVRMTRPVRFVVSSGLVVGLSVAPSACGGHSCGLSLDGHVISQGFVPCCGQFVMKDVVLPNAGDAQFDMVNAAQVPEAADAFLVPTSCSKLFDGDYPGSAALCTVYLGPVVPNTVSGRVQLNAGTYRVWIQGYTGNTAASTSFYIDIGVYDYRCSAVTM